MSATIHVRIAAQRDSGSEAHACLATCLKVFNENQETNWAVRRANVVIKNLMNRMHVVIRDEQVPQVIDNLDDTQLGRRTATSSGENTASDPVMSGAPQNNNNNNNNSSNNSPSVLNVGVSDGEPFSPDLDIDAIIQSFIREQQTGEPRSQLARNAPISYTPADSVGQWLPSTSLGIQTGLGTEATNGASERSLPYAEDNSNINGMWTSESYSGGASVNDMLFGFNSSAVDSFG